MFTSVFSPKRKQTTSTKQKKFSTIVRRTQSPPSPASFVSPEIVEINEKGPFGAALPDPQGPSTSFDHSAATSPQIELEFDNDDSLSEWYPPNLMTLASENITPPKRNVSLPNGGRAGPDGPSVSGYKARASPEASVKEVRELREVRNLVVLLVPSCSFFSARPLVRRHFGAPPAHLLR